MDRKDGIFQSESTEPAFKEVLESKLFVPEKAKQNESLRRVRAPEIMAAFAEHLNASAEDSLSRSISGIWGWSGVRPTNFTVSENFYPRHEHPYVALSADTDMDIRIGGRRGPLIKSGTKVDLFWLETDEEDPSKLFLAWKSAKVILPGDSSTYILRKGAIYYYELSRTDPEELFAEVFDMIVGWGRLSDREVRLSLDSILIASKKALHAESHVYFKEILNSKLAELHTAQTRRNETLVRAQVSDVMGFLAEHLNKGDEDRLSLAISRIWGSELKPVNFCAREWLYPESTRPGVVLEGETTGEVCEESTDWFYHPQRPTTLLYVGTGFEDLNQLLLTVRYAEITSNDVLLRSGKYQFKGGEYQVFELSQTQNPKELLSEIVDLLVEPRKLPLRKHSFSFSYF